MIASPPAKKNFSTYALRFLGMTIGAFLTALSIEVFLIPNGVIDGGIVGISLILGEIYSHGIIPYALVILNLPFLILAYRSIGKQFVIQMFLAVLLFAGFMSATESWAFLKGQELDTVEVIFLGGVLLGAGLGTIIRNGGCLDGTEILGILINKKLGFTVGQVVLFFNFFIFTAAGLAFNDWHSPLKSLMTFLVAIKIMDLVIVGLEETKSVKIISTKSQDIADAIIHELGLGLTIMYGRGGFSGEQREIVYVIAERLQLSRVKEITFREDPHAFLAIENIHEVSTGAQTHRPKVHRSKKKGFLARISSFFSV